MCDWKNGNSKEKASRYHVNSKEIAVYEGLNLFIAHKILSSVPYLLSVKYTPMVVCWLVNPRKLVHEQDVLSNFTLLLCSITLKLRLKYFIFPRGKYDPTIKIWGKPRSVFLQQLFWQWSGVMGALHTIIKPLVFLALHKSFHKVLNINGAVG